jgi:endoglucanase
VTLRAFPAALLSVLAVPACLPVATDQPVTTVPATGSSVGSRIGSTAGSATGAGTAASIAASTEASTMAAAPGNPFAGARLYVERSSPAARAAARYRRTSPAKAATFDKIARQSVARWWGDWNATHEVRDEVDAATAEITRAGALPVYVVYNVMHRDGGTGYSSGGAPTLRAYRAWIDEVAIGIRGRRAVFIVEPDAVMDLARMTGRLRAERIAALNYAVDRLRAAGRVTVYLDAGNSRAHPARTTARLLNAAGLQRARGFSLNVSNFQRTRDEAAYGTLIARYAGGQKRFVIDTSRNGRGSIDPDTDEEYWCNPPGRALGTPPSAITGRVAVDAYLWVKPPGESDGTCRGFPEAGVWVEAYAYALARNASW